MTDREPFDENEPFDAIAQMSKTAIAHAFRNAHSSAKAISPDEALQIEALIAGAVVGVCGCAMSMFQADAHGEVRAMLQAYLPQAFDQARSIAGLPPLGEPS